MGEYRVHALEVLQGQSRAEEAKDILTRVAKQIEPLMAKYKWRVLKLAEFFPKSPGLLGLNYNRGQKILLRLRPHDSPGSFMDMESILGTMLHELVHNEIGEHSDKFYTRLEGLTAECEQLMMTGLNALTSRHVPYSGEGQTLGGGGGAMGGDTAAVRAARAAAAERRRQRGAVMPGGGQKLGGGGGAVAGGKDGLRERIRDAAERRAQDAKRCRTATQQAEAGPSSGAKDGWACPLCSFRNPGGAAKCGVCDSPRGAATQDASQGLDDVFVDLEDNDGGGASASDGDGEEGDKKPSAAAAAAAAGNGSGDGGWKNGKDGAASSSSSSSSPSSNGGGGSKGQRQQQEREEERKEGGWRCEGTGVGCGLLNEAGAGRCARCGHTRRLPSDPSNINTNGNGGLSQQGRKKRPLSPSSLAGMGMEENGDEGDVEAAMLAAALAASAAEQKGPSSGGGGGGGEEAIMARALAASTHTWQCGACTLENVGDGVKCSLCGTARGDGGGSSSDKGGGVVDLTEEDDGLKSEKLVV